MRPVFWFRGKKTKVSVGMQNQANYGETEKKKSNFWFHVKSFHQSYFTSKFSTKVVQLWINLGPGRRNFFFFFFSKGTKLENIKIPKGPWMVVSLNMWACNVLVNWPVWTLPLNHEKKKKLWFSISGYCGVCIKAPHIRHLFRANQTNLFY